MSGSLKSVRWDAYVHRLDLGLYCYPKELWGTGVRNHVNSTGKNPLYRRLRGGSTPRPCITQDSELNTLPTELFRPPDRKTDPHLPSQCGSTYNCLDRPVPDTHSVCC